MANNHNVHEVGGIATKSYGGWVSGWVGWTLQGLTKRWAKDFKYEEIT